MIKIENFEYRGINIPNVVYVIRYIDYSLEQNKLHFFGGVWASEEAYKEGKEAINPNYFGFNINNVPQDINISEYCYNYIKDNSDIEPFKKYFKGIVK